MQNPDNLRVSRDAEELADRVYDFTARFPGEEQFGLTQRSGLTADYPLRL